jgi:hypothetical protein
MVKQWPTRGTIYYQNTVFHPRIQPPNVTLSEAKGLQDSSVAEFILSEAEVLPQNDTRVNGYYFILF